MPYQLSGQFFLCEGMHEKEIAAGKWKNGGCQQKLLEKDGRCLCGMDEAVGEVGKEQNRDRKNNDRKDKEYCTCRCGIFLWGFQLNFSVKQKALRGGSALRRRGAMSLLRSVEGGNYF